MCVCVDVFVCVCVHACVCACVCVCPCVFCVFLPFGCTHSTVELVLFSTLLPIAVALTFQCVIMTEASLSLQVRIDEFCRSHQPPIAVSTLWGACLLVHCFYGLTLSPVHLVWSEGRFLLCFLWLWTLFHCGGPQWGGWSGGLCGEHLYGRYFTMCVCWCLCACMVCMCVSCVHVCVKETGCFLLDQFSYSLLWYLPSSLHPPLPPFCPIIFLLN